MIRKPFVPAGGFAGFAEQTVAVKTLVSRSVKPARKDPRKRRAVARKKPVRGKRGPMTPKVRRRKTAAKKKPARLVKGSAAAKRYMAKIRKMRKR